ncbi:MAG: hypothetical protein KGI60_03945 [Patescibacteria group bacterium]|nr:hypothetical protein [Patescibacteria group bacterium]
MIKTNLKKTVNQALAAGLVLNVLSSTTPALSPLLAGNSLPSSTPETLVFSPAQTAPDATTTLSVTVTAYSSTVSQTDSTPFIAASGKHVYDGIIAANFLPFGTKVKIPALFGDKIFTVDDRMNRRYPDRVDVWFPTTSQAKHFGIKKTDIVIISS